MIRSRASRSPISATEKAGADAAKTVDKPKGGGVDTPRTGDVDAPSTPGAARADAPSVGDGMPGKAADLDGGPYPRGELDIDLDNYFHPGESGGVKYTADDVRTAFDNAPNNNDGVPVDHRTGEPLVLTDAAGKRGWTMRQDADGVWRAENYALHPDGMPKKGTPNSYGYDANGDLRKYAENRPSHKPEDIKTVWDTTHTDINNLIEDGVLRDLPKLDRPDQTWLRAPDGAQPNGKNIRETYNTRTGETEVYQLETWKPGDKQSWDMGHVKGEEYRRIHDDYMRGKYATDEDFVKDFQRLKNYEAANASRNRSHVDEDMTPLPPRP